MRCQSHALKASPKRPWNGQLPHDTPGVLEHGLRCPKWAPCENAHRFQKKKVYMWASGIHPFVSDGCSPVFSLAKRGCKLTASPQVGTHPMNSGRHSRGWLGTQELSSPEEMTCDTSDFIMFKWEQHEKHDQRRQRKNKFLNLPRSSTDVDGGVWSALEGPWIWTHGSAMTQGSEPPSHQCGRGWARLGPPVVQVGSDKLTGLCVSRWSDQWQF